MPIIARVVFLFVFLVASTSKSAAAVSVKDVQTIVRTIGFLDNASLSRSTIAVVYDSSNASSLQDAKDFSQIIEKEGKGLHVRLVPAAALSDLGDANFAFLVNGTSGYQKKFGEVTRSAKILSFALDRNCVTHDNCAVFVNSDDRVEIIINKKVSDSVGAAFKPVFLMMVTVR